jgi:ParB family chromosome partitioning protein
MGQGGCGARLPRNPRRPHQGAHRRLARPHGAIRRDQGLRESGWQGSPEPGDKAHILDAELLHRLAAEKLEPIATSLRGEGWKWVDIAPDANWQELEKYKRIKQDFTGNATYSKADMAESGCIIRLGHGKGAEIVRGLLTAEDAKVLRQEQKAKSGKRGGKSEAKKDASGISAALASELTTHRTISLQAKLAANPKVALIAIVHSMLLNMEDGLDIKGTKSSSVIEITPRTKLMRPEMQKTPAWKEKLDATRAATKNMPLKDDQIWDWLAKQDQKRLLEILGVCAAATVDAVQHQDDRNPDADQLAAALKLDMTDHWEPTATSYFDRVSSAQIIAAVTEACGKVEAAKLVGMKKGDMAEAAERLTKGKGWLPAILRGGKGA